MQLRLLCAPNLGCNLGVRVSAVYCCGDIVQESIVAASLEFVRVEGQLQGVGRSLHKLQSEIDSCVKGAQVRVCAWWWW